MACAAIPRGAQPGQSFHTSVRLSAVLIANELQAHGFTNNPSMGPHNPVAIGTAIALAESGGDPGAVYIERDGAPSVGLWQIYSTAHPEVPASDACTPALAVPWVYRISQGGRNWSAWSTYTHGTYRQYLARSMRAAETVRVPSTADQIGSAIGGTASTILGIGEDVLAASFGPLGLLIDKGYDAVKAIAMALAWLTNPHNWLRLAEATGGAALVGVGLFVIVQTTKAGREITQAVVTKKTGGAVPPA